MGEKGFPRLTKKTAQALAVQVVGTAKGLTKDERISIDTYKMEMGELCVTIQHDWYGKSGCIMVSVSSAYHSGGLNLLFDPDTLEENFQEEEKRKRQQRRESLQEWVWDNGVEKCKAEIDKADKPEYLRGGAVMGATKERRTSKAYWSGLVRQLEHQKDRTKARRKQNRKRTKKHG